MTNTIFVYKAKRRRNSLTYVPYKKFYNSLYNHIDIDSVLEKIGTENMTSIVCQGNLTGDFVRNALGFDELEDYEDEEDTVTVDDDSKGVDILIVWTDKKPNEGNIKKQIQSIRGVAGLFIRRDKNRIKYAEVAIICNASSSKMKTRKANVKTRGKEILQIIDVIARDKKCKYVSLKALDNVITYYHKFGFRLVNYPFHKERPEISEYVGRLGRINTEIDKINNKRSTRKHRKHHDNSKLEKLHREKDVIMEKFKRFLVGLYNVKERANFRYSETPDTEDETGDDFIEDLSDSGYRMYKPLVRRTPTASGRKTRKKTKKRRRNKTRSKRGGSAAGDRTVNEGKWLIKNNKDSIEHWIDFVLPTLNADDDDINTINNAMNFFITELEYFDDMGQEEREESMGEDYDKTWNYVELEDRSIQFGHTHETDRDTARDEFELGPDAEIIDR